jgi:broad specificity phosphatase PhoE
MTRFIIFRHGQTEWNVERRMQGQNDIALNKNGRNQAELLAQRLQHEMIDAFYSSPLSRAFETAETVARKHGKLVTVLDSLIEMSFGDMEGKTKSERLALFPTFDVTSDEHRKLVSMETFADVVPDLKEKIIPTLLEKHRNQTVVLSTHDQKMRAILIALGMPETVKGELLKNCAVTILEKNNDGLKVICHNNNSHLEENI